MRTKRVIRREMSRKRDGLRSEEVRSMSNGISRRLERLSEYGDCFHILFFMSRIKEVQTKPLIEEAMKAGKKVYLPVTDVRERKIRITRFLGPDIGFEKGAFGIMEPAEQFREWIEPRFLDMVLVPGLAFDDLGSRIGYGGGYFDRFLRDVRRDAWIVGLAYDFQLMHYLPQTESDRKVSFVVTEKRTIDCRNSPVAKGFIYNY